MWNHKFPILGLLLLAVITACVSLPHTEQTADSGQNSPGVAMADPGQNAAAAPAGLVEAVAPPAERQAAGAAAPAQEPAIAPEVTVLQAGPASRQQQAELAVLNEQVEALCRQIGSKLGSVSAEDCLRQSFRFGGGFSLNQRPLVVKELAPSAATDEHFRVLLLGGIHGDEYASISIIFKWLELFSHAAQEGNFHWRIAPLANPDGLLDGSKAVRQNANGVDLNRNFPSRDWNEKAAEYWQVNTGSNPRRFPGSAAASEPEVQWILQQIEEFQPDVIVSVHAPYHLLDFDGPAEAPQRIGELYLHQLGVYPGSLGNFAGLDRQIPVITLELPSAGILPDPDEIRVMWRDLVAWLDSTGRKTLASRF